MCVGFVSSGRKSKGSYALRTTCPEASHCWSNLEAWTVAVGYLKTLGLFTVCIITMQLT